MKACSATRSGVAKPRQRSAERAREIGGSAKQAFSLAGEAHSVKGPPGRAANGSPIFCTDRRPRSTCRATAGSYDHTTYCVGHERSQSQPSEDSAAREGAAVSPTHAPPRAFAQSERARPLALAFADPWSATTAVYRGALNACALYTEVPSPRVTIGGISAQYRARQPPGQHARWW